MARQLAFDLPPDVRLEREDFFVSAANETAFAMIDAPLGWPDGKLALVGPAGSGKTHLARVFGAQMNALILPANDVAPDAPLPNCAVVVEDGHALPRRSEEWLFHTHNHLRTHDLPLLITGNTPPARWDIALPDLKSRLVAATVVSIDAPDDALLMAVLLKHFADRQLSPAPEAITYLQTHLPRTFDAIRDAVAMLDTESLTQRKPLTRTFVRGQVERWLDSRGPDG